MARRMKHSSSRGRSKAHTVLASPQTFVMPPLPSDSPSTDVSGVIANDVELVAGEF